MFTPECPHLQFEATRPEDWQELVFLNEAGELWLGGELDTGTYEDILENLGEIKDPDAFIRSAQCFYPHL